MKLKNRVMSWILHPSAYLVWHSMGNPEEWENDDGKYLRTMRHRPTGVHFWIGNSSFFFDGYGSQWKHSIGLLDRHLLWPRARKLRRAWRKEFRKQSDVRQKLFVEMTQLTGKQ